MRRARDSTGHSEERLLIAQVTANREGHSSGPDKLAPHRGLLNRASR
jgi:hypothetical protein